MAKAKKETKKKITLKNFKDYALEQLSKADSKGITLISSSLLVEVEEKFDNESDISLAYNAIKDILKWIGYKYTHKS